MPTWESAIGKDRMGMSSREIEQCLTLLNDLQRSAEQINSKADDLLEGTLSFLDDHGDEIAHTEDERSLSHQQQEIVSKWGKTYEEAANGRLKQLLTYLPNSGASDSDKMAALATVERKANEQNTEAAAITGTHIRMLKEAVLLHRWDAPNQCGDVTPENIATLSPKYVPAEALKDGWSRDIRFVPIDPCNKGFALWSAGPNGSFDIEGVLLATNRYKDDASSDDLVYVCEPNLGTQQWIQNHWQQ
jgi:hypothetical protein